MIKRPAMQLGPKGDENTKELLADAMHMETL